LKTVIYSDDINLLSYWEKALNFECMVVEDMEKLKDVVSSVVVVNYSACISTCRAFLQDLLKNNNRVFVMHRLPDINVAKKLLKCGVKGYGNALMREHFIVSAIEAIKDDMVWLHPEFTSMLIMDLPSLDREKKRVHLDKLTQREVEVALLLEAGQTYRNIADELNISPRTVKAHAQSIYTKLNVKDRLALALLLNS